MPATGIREAAGAATHLVERVQTGVRLEKRLLKVLKTLAEYLDISLGDLLEGVVLHAFDGKQPFGAETRQRIDQLREFYGLDLRAEASHRLVERTGTTKRPGKPPAPPPATALKRPRKAARPGKETQRT